MKVFSIRKERILIVVYLVIILAGIIKTWGDRAVTTFSMPMSKKVILIDPGHGGDDPGKVGQDVLEKDINLEIAKKLQAYLELGGSTVLMTRTDDTPLADSKRGDMRSRKLVADTSKADMFISIHQNSYPSPSVQGAQVFYYKQSESSKRLAETIQIEIKSFADTNNQREAKSDANYYVLKQTSMPAVIVECGFLSNKSDSANLQAGEYQEKIAWAIYTGIVKYYEEEPGEKSLQ